MTIGSSLSTLSIDTIMEAHTSFEGDATMEIWKLVKDLPGYPVSNEGKIKKDSTGQIMALSHNGGYTEITITKHVHRLVVEAFIEKSSIEKCWVDHIDGNRGNNNVNSLRWVTPSENCSAYGYKSRRLDRMKKIEAMYIDGNELIFNSRQGCAVYFNCSDGEIHYNKFYKKGNKKGWILQKVKDIV